jgi:hypothetical protein
LERKKVAKFDVFFVQVRKKGVKTLQKISQKLKKVSKGSEKKVQVGKD